MSHERVEKLIARLDEIESNHQTTSRRLRTAAKVAAVVGVGIVGVDLLASGPLDQATELGSVFIVPAAGLGVAGEVFDRFADKAGLQSERLIDRLNKRYKLRRSRLTLVR